MEIFLSTHVLISFIALLTLEVVLGIDNLILISILTDKLPKAQQPLARKIGIVGAMVMRLLLLSLIFALTYLTETLFTLFGVDFSWREILLILGGVFLIAKATLEIHHKIEGATEDHTEPKHYKVMWIVVAQIMMLDVVFSFDSVLTAVGVADHLPVMVAAIVASVIFMMVAMETVNNFISRHPTVKVLALSYMLLIGFALVGEGFHQEIPKGYLYFAMAFSLGVEMLNVTIRARSAAKKTLHHPSHRDDEI